jgi:hypothetical protein
METMASTGRKPGILGTFLENPLEWFRKAVTVSVCIRDLRQEPLL